MQDGKPVGQRKYVEVEFYDPELCEKMTIKLRKFEWEGSKLLVYRGGGKKKGR